MIPEPTNIRSNWGQDCMNSLYSASVQKQNHLNIQRKQNGHLQTSRPFRRRHHCRLPCCLRRCQVSQTRILSLLHIQSSHCSLCHPGQQRRGTANQITARENQQKDRITDVSALATSAKSPTTKKSTSTPTASRPSSWKSSSGSRNPTPKPWSTISKTSSPTMKTMPRRRRGFGGVGVRLGGNYRESFHFTILSFSFSQKTTY